MAGNKMEDNKKEVDVETVSVADADATVANENTTPDGAGENNPNITELQTQVADLTDKYMRAVAELENTRRRAARDAESVARTAGMNTAKKFLPVMDALVPN